MLQLLPLNEDPGNETVIDMNNESVAGKDKHKIIIRLTVSNKTDVPVLQAIYVKTGYLTN